MVYRSLLRGAASYTLSNFAVAGIPFLLLPVLTRLLDPAAYGVVAMFSLVIAFMSVGVGLNIHGAITVRYFQRSNFDIARYVSTTLIILFLSTLVMLALVFLVGMKISELTSVPVGWLYIAVLVASLQFLVQILLTLWQASKKPIQYGLLRISHALLDVISSIIFVVLFALSWQGRLSGMLAASACVAIIAFYFLIREGWVAKSTHALYAKDALSYGIPLIPHALGGLVLGIADRFLVNNLLDVASLGIYVVAVQLGLILGVLVESFNKAFAPWLMEKLTIMDLATRKQIVNFTYIYFVVVISLAALGSFIVPYILPLVVGPKFQTAGPLITYILFGNAFMGMYYMVTNYIFFSRKTGLLSALTISVGSLTLGLSWILINAYGVKGAAIGFMLGQLSLFLGAWLLSNFCFPMPWLKILTINKDV